MKVRYFTIPNIITLLNLFCGSMAIVSTLAAGDLRTAFWLIVVAAILDFLDGMAARVLKQYSAIGKELDSLADMVSFGLAPAAMTYMVCMGQGGGNFPLIVFIIALFSALRLARFNVDEGQKDLFIGLPTPANAIFFASLGWLYAEGMFALDMLWMILASVVMSLLLISPIKMFSLKFHNLSLKDRNNIVRFGFLLVSLGAIILFQIAAIPFIILGYIAISVCMNVVCKGN